MILYYGPISLNLLKLKSLSKEAVYDGTTYIWTKFVVDVEAIFNPGTQEQNYLWQPKLLPNNTLPVPYFPRQWPITVPGLPYYGVPGGQPNSLVPGSVSAAAVQHDLLQPRRPLLLSVGGVPVLFAPYFGFSTDANNGPKPLYCHVTEIEGTRTFRVNYVIETCINECYTQVGTDAPMILSYAFGSRHTIDQDYFTTVTYEGRSTFRTDAVLADGHLMDWWRWFVVPIVPAGFKRESIDVWIDVEHPNVLQYKVVDRETPLIWDRYRYPNVTRCNATLSVGLHQKGASLDGVRRAFAPLNAKNDIAQLVDMAKNSVAFLTESSIFLQNAVTKDFFTRSPVRRLNATTYQSVDIEAWGSPLCTKGELERMCREIITAIFVYLIKIRFQAGGLPAAPPTPLNPNPPAPPANGGAGVAPALIVGAALNLPEVLQGPLLAVAAGLQNGGGTGAVQAIGAVTDNFLADNWAVVSKLFQMAEFEVSYDMFAKHVKVHFMLTAGPIISQLSSMITFLSWDALEGNTDPLLPYDSLMLNRNPVITDHNRLAIGPPYDGSTRANPNIFLIAQELREACSRGSWTERQIQQQMQQPEYGEWIPQYGQEQPDPGKPQPIEGIPYKPPGNDLEGSIATTPNTTPGDALEGSIATTPDPSPGNGPSPIYPPL